MKKSKESSKFYHLIHLRQHSFHFEFVLQQSAERFALFLFTVRYNYFWFRWCERREPIKQICLSRVCAEPVQCCHFRFHFMFLAENLHHIKFVNEFSTK